MRLPLDLSQLCVLLHEIKERGIDAVRGCWWRNINNIIYDRHWFGNVSSLNASFVIKRRILREPRVSDANVLKGTEFAQS